MSLNQKLIPGIIWAFSETFLVKSVQFVALIILARWLGPKSFGLVGMIAIFVSIGKTLTDSGLSNSLIRTSKTNELDYSTVFITNILISVFTYLVVFFLAPMIASFFNQPILTDILRLYCLVFIITAFSAVHLAILTKNMEFKQIMNLSLPGIIIGSALGLFLGYNGYGVWSIVWMYFITEMVKVFFLWKFSKWKPKFLFSKSKFKYHFNFGYKLMISELISTVFKNIYNVLIGKYYLPQTLGHFERSREIGQFPSQTLTGVISRVAYPLLSGMQDDSTLLEKTNRELIKISFFLIAPLMLFTAAVAEPLFLLLFGEEWIPAVIFFQILSLAMIIYPIHAFNLNILKIYGRSDLFLKLEIIKKLVAVVAIVVAFQFGVIGLVWSSVFTSFFALYVNMYYSSRLMNYPVLSQLKDLSLTLILSLITAVLMYYFSQTLLNTNLIVQLLLSYTFGVVFYIGVNYINKKSPLHLMLNLLKKQNR